MRSEGELAEAKRDLAVLLTALQEAEMLPDELERVREAAQEAASELVSNKAFQTKVRLWVF